MVSKKTLIDEILYMTDGLANKDDLNKLTIKELANIVAEKSMDFLKTEQSAKAVRRLKIKSVIEEEELTDIEVSDKIKKSNTLLLCMNNTNMEENTSLQQLLIYINNLKLNTSSIAYENIITVDNPTKHRVKVDIKGRFPSDLDNINKTHKFNYILALYCPFMIFNKQIIMSMVNRLTDDGVLVIYTGGYLRILPMLLDIKPILLNIITMHDKNKLFIIRKKIDN